MGRAETSPLRHYIDQLAAGRLAFQRCPETGRAVFYPRLIAPGSGTTPEWHDSAGLGTVHATTVVHPQDGAPYNVALIDMDEGFRLMSRVEDIAPEQVRIGQRVRFRVHHPEGEELPCPVFFPAETGA